MHVFLYAISLEGFVKRFKMGHFVRVLPCLLNVLSTLDDSGHFSSL